MIAALPYPLQPSVANACNLVTASRSFFTRHQPTPRQGCLWVHHTCRNASTCLPCPPSPYLALMFQGATFLVFFHSVFVQGLLISTGCLTPAYIQVVCTDPNSARYSESGKEVSPGSRVGGGLNWGTGVYVRALGWLLCRCIQSYERMDGCC